MSPTTSPRPELYSLGEAAARLGCSAKTLRRLEQRGKVRFPRTALGRIVPAELLEQLRGLVRPRKERAS